MTGCRVKGSTELGEEVQYRNERERERETQMLSDVTPVAYAQDTKH
jgi:hypothetical protein